MKLDMHCHTMEGSSDSKVPIREYIELLKSQGFDGMLVTDHDSYGGYNYYLSHKEEMPDNFYVFKGIEYDTLEAGHFLVIMPDEVTLDILECRGLSVKKLIDIVHIYGGILGPAHPCGEPFLSIFSTGRYRKDTSIAEQFDFIECFNCGEDPWANERAVRLSEEYGLPAISGSDAHWQTCVGLAGTELSQTVHNNDELIDFFRAHKQTKIWGQPYSGTLKARLGKWNKILVYGFFPYNKLGALKFIKKRKKCLSGL